MQVQTHLSEKKTNWIQTIHQQIGHRDNRTLVRLLKQRGTHVFLKMTTEHRCNTCEESKPQTHHFFERQRSWCSSEN